MKLHNLIFLREIWDMRFKEQARCLLFYCNCFEHHTSYSKVIELEDVDSTKVDDPDLAEALKNEDNNCLTQYQLGSIKKCSEEFDAGIERKYGAIRKRKKVKRTGGGGEGKCKVVGKDKGRGNG